MRRKWYRATVVVVFFCLVMALAVQGYEVGHQLTHKCFVRHCQECELLLVLGQIAKNVQPKPPVPDEEDFVAIVMPIMPSCNLQASFTAVDAKVRLDC